MDVKKKSLPLAAEVGDSMNVIWIADDCALELVDKYDQLYATIGWHPTEAGTYTEDVENYLLEKLKHPKLLPCDLDYHWMTAPKEVQDVFRRQIQLSTLPLTVHTR